MDLLRIRQQALTSCGCSKNIQNANMTCEKYPEDSALVRGVETTVSAVSV